MHLRILSLLVILGLWLYGFNDFYKQVHYQKSGYNQAIEGLVILTGSNLRIRSGLQIFKKTQAKRLLISGIDQNVTLNALKSTHFKGNENLLTSVDLGYGSFSTHSNALETALWVQNNHFKIIGLVTSKIHMPRSILIFKQIMPDVEIIPFIVESQHKSIFSVLKEFHKFYLTKIIGYFLFARYKQPIL
jgi:uncharacterized SAM-binding protein YcdF (DUF218 family)